MALDRTDRRILAALQERGRMPNVELAGLVGLSESPCFRRVRNLERRGVIRGYAAAVDPRALDLKVTAFVLVTLEKQSEARTGKLYDRIRGEPHILECHAMSGRHDLILKVVARDIDHFSELVMRGILRYPGVLHVESSFSMSEIKDSPVLPA